MSEHHDEAMHEDIPVMGDLDSDSNGVLTWEEYSSRLRNHVKQLIEEGRWSRGRGWARTDTP